MSIARPSLHTPSRSRGCNGSLGRSYEFAIRSSADVSPLRCSLLRGSTPRVARQVLLSAVPDTVPESAADVSTDKRVSRKEQRMKKVAEEEEALVALRLQQTAESIQRGVEEKERQIRRKAVEERLDSELKFGKRLAAEGDTSRALPHFAKVVAQSSPDSWLRCEATLQQGLALLELGQTGAATAALQRLVGYRAPYPNIKRRAQMAIEAASVPRPSSLKLDTQAEGDGDRTRKVMATGLAGLADGDSGEGRSGSAELAGNNWLKHVSPSSYSLYMSGYDSYVRKDSEQSASKEMNMLFVVLPWCILLLGPALIVGLLLGYFN